MNVVNVSADKRQPDVPKTAVEVRRVVRLIEGSIERSLKSQDFEVAKNLISKRDILLWLLGRPSRFDEMVQLMAQVEATLVPGGGVQ